YCRRRKFIFQLAFCYYVIDCPHPVFKYIKVKMNTHDMAQRSLWQAWALQARKNPRVTAGLLGAGACLLLLLLAGAYRAMTSVDDAVFDYALIGGFAGFV